MTPFWHAIRRHPDLFLDKSTFSMDWYYPVLGGAVRGDAARTLLAGRWEEFVRPGLGVRCVDTDPWVTGAETCELALALDALGDRETAVRLVAEIQRLREPVVLALSRSPTCTVPPGCGVAVGVGVGGDVVGVGVGWLPGLQP